MDNDPGDFAQRNVRFFRTLAALLGVGFTLALVVGFGIKDLPGFWDLTAFSRALFLAALVVAVVLALFLLRIGVIFDVERQVKTLFDSESDRLQAMRKQEEDAAREFRDGLRRDLAEMREAVRRDFNERDGKFDNAILAANKAMKMAADAMSRIEALSREPAYRSTIEQLARDLGDMKKDLTALRTADRVNSPLLAELKERVGALEGAQKKTNVRIDETLEGMERRDMEQAAMRQTLDDELGKFRKREALLLVKQRELEDANAHLASSARKPKTQLSPAEEKEHVLAIGAIGPAYASRLNAQGVITVPQLLAVDADNVASAIGAEPGQVKEWQAMAGLMRLKGLGPQSAEILVRSGVTGAQQLAAETGESVAAKVKEAARSRKVQLQGLDVTPALAQKWVEAARGQP